MTIRLFCPSGHRLSVPDSNAGKKVRCARCKKIAFVPQLATAKPSSQQVGLDDAQAVKTQPAADSQPPPLPGGKSAKKEKPSKSKPKLPDLPSKSKTPDPSPPGAIRPPLPSSGSPTSTPPPKPDSQPPPRAEPKAEAEPTEPKSQSARRKRRRERKRSRRKDKKWLSAKGPKAEQESTDHTEQPPKRKRTRRVHRPRGPKRMPADVYVPDQGKVVTVKWLAFFLGLAVLFSLGPVIYKMHLNLEVAPGWARMVLLLAAVQTAYIAWMLNAPDWSSVWVVMLVFAGVAALYGMATALALATPVHEPMLLGMEEVRYPAKAWCGAVMSVMSLATYLCGRTSAKWRRTFELEMAGKGTVKQ